MCTGKFGITGKRDIDRAIGHVRDAGTPTTPARIAESAAVDARQRISEILISRRP